MKQKRTYIYLIIILTLAAAGCIFFINKDLGVPKSGYEIKPADGVLDLSPWDPEAHGLLGLSGGWNFYWNRLLTFHELGGASPDMVVSVPSVWSSYTVENKRLPGFGYATYVLNVKNFNADMPLALRFANAGTAYRLYVNDSLIASNGVVGTSAEESKPEYRLKKLQFQPPGKDFAIVLQISNFDYSKGGMWYPLYIGTPQAVSGLNEGIAYRDLFLLGAFVILALYYLTIFLMKRDYKGSLYFVLLCFIAIIRTLIAGDYVIYKLLPFVGFTATATIDYISLYWFPAVFLLLYRNLIPAGTPLRLIKPLVGFGGAMTLFALIMPVYIFASAGWLVEGVILGTVIYAMISAGLNLSKHPTDTAVLLLGGSSMAFGVIHDTLLNNNLLESRLGDLSATCFLILIALSAFLLAKNLKESYDREKRAELKFLQSQIRPHFIHNALNTVISVSRRDGDAARRLLVEFSKYLRHCFDFENLDELVPLEQELDFIRAYVSIERARFGDRLEVEYDIDEMTLRIPPLILQPLVENAVIHGLRMKPEGGSILVYAKKSTGSVTIGVRDTGTGIPEAVLSELEKGSRSARGVGLDNINLRLKRLYGVSLRIKSVLDKGTDISMEIPFRGGGKNAESLFD